MTTLLGVLLSCLLSGAPGEKPADRVELRLYPIPLVTNPRLDYYAKPLGFFPVLQGVSGLSGENSPQWTLAYRTNRLEADALLEIIRSTAAPGIWDEVPGASIQYCPDLLLVSHTVAEHDRIRDLLALVEATLSRRYAIQAIVVPAAAMASVAAPILSPAEVRRLSEAEGAVVQVALAETGQRIVLGAATGTSYVSGFNVEIAQKSQMAEPLMSLIRDGVSIGIRPRFAGAGFVALDATAEIASLHRPMAQLQLQARGLGRVELPSLDVTRAGASAVVAEGGGLLLGCVESATGAGRSAVVVSAVPLGLDTPIRPPLALIDVDFIVRQTERFQVHKALSEARELFGIGGRDVFLTPPPPPGDPAITGPEASDPVLPIELVQQLLVAAGGEMQERETIDAVGRNLIWVRAEPAKIERINAAVDALRRARRRTGTVEVALVKLSPTARKKLDPVRGVLPDDVSESVLAGKSGVVVTRAASACLAGDSAVIAIGNESALVSDYSVEVAQSARICEPVVHHRFQGLDLQVRPEPGVNPGTLAVEVRGSLTRPNGETTAESTFADDVGVIQKTSETAFDLRGTWNVTPGRWTYRLIEDGPDGALALALRCSLREE